MLVVLPIIRLDTAARCLNSITRENSAAGFTREEMLLVDNTESGSVPGAFPGFRVHRDPGGHNIGVARAWNVGIREVLNSKLAYVVFLSASVEFGPELHTTWKGQMEEFWGSHVIEGWGHSWHLIAFHRRVFETVGLFDENFYPAYFEAIDFGYRMRICGQTPDNPGDMIYNPEIGLEQDFKRVWVNAISWGAGQHIDMADMPAAPLLKYYRDKWGGDKGEEQWTLPWNGKPLDYFPEKSIPDLAREYGLNRWW